MQNSSLGILTKNLDVPIYGDEIFPLDSYKTVLHQGLESLVPGVNGQDKKKILSFFLDIIAFLIKLLIYYDVHKKHFKKKQIFLYLTRNNTFRADYVDLHVSYNVLIATGFVTLNVFRKHCCMFSLWLLKI